MSVSTEAAVYTDFDGLARLKTSARQNSSESLRQVAQQFEGLFVQMMLKGMRAGDLGDDLFESKATEFYEGMFDSQMALELSSGRGLGLADMLVRQLGGESEQQPGVPTPSLIPPPRPWPARFAAALPQPQNVAPASWPAAPPADGSWRVESPQEFVSQLWPHAQEAGRELGIDPKVLLAQSALETGWGKSVMRQRDGSSSYNLFGIKAGNNWNGARVTMPTLEYEDGIAVRRFEAFRAYASPADSFRDYVDFLRANPRYRDALAHGGSNAHFVNGLQRAGYATDPQYAEKIRSILHSEKLKAAAAEQNLAAAGS